MTEALAGRRIALAETRELDLLGSMLERDGARTLRCPLVAILDVPDPSPVEAWIARAIEGRLDDVVFYTGEGIRRLLGVAERSGQRERFIEALGKIRKVTRGPKPVRALREIGLAPDRTAKTPTTDGLIATLAGETLSGRRVGVQIYGQDPNATLLGFLQSQGAIVDLVAPYLYASKADDARVSELIQEMAAGRVDAIAFTSSPQVQRLADVAESTALRDMLREGLRRTKIVAVGPVVAEELVRRGFSADATAPAPFSLKPLVTAVQQLFAANR